jgi:hypothetical protein
MTSCGRISEEKHFLMDDLERRQIEGALLFCGLFLGQTQGRNEPRLGFHLVGK